MQALEYVERALGLVKSSGQAALLDTQSDLQLLLDSLQQNTGETLWMFIIHLCYVVQVRTPSQFYYTRLLMFL